MDKGAIFTAITKRNALRTANGLPALNIHSEYARQVAIAKQRDYRALCDQHADEREAIRHKVLAELRLEHGPDFGTGFGGRWIVGRLTQRRFAAYIAQRYGLFPEGGGRNDIIYGETLKDA